MNKKVISIVIGAMLLAMMLGACAPAVSTPGAVETTAPKPAEANFPTGKFIKSGETDYGLKFNADGTFSVFQGENTYVTGTYKVDGDVFTETSNDGGCDTNVSFNYTFDGSNLTFKYAGDPAKDEGCTGRHADFNNVTYSLVEETSSPAVVELPVITIDAADYSYTAPEAISGGWVRVILTNSGAEPHHVQFLRLNDGVTVQQFEEALKQGEGPALAMTKQVGGVGAIHPGGAAQAVINLPAGEYVILCFVPSPSDHVAHLAKGMIKNLKVEAASDNPTSEPTASLTVNLKDFMFEMPESLPAGEIVVKVVNDGPEPHEFNILRLEDGKTVEDVMKFLSGEAEGPPPFAPVGGMNGLDKGQFGYAELNLTPGTYVAICNIPSPNAEGHPHFTLGMIKEFSVK